MNNLKVFKTVIILSVLLTLFSCKKDDKNVDFSNDLIGEWQRSDVSPEFEYQLIFYANHSGLKTERVGDLNGQSISSAITFDWSTNETILNLDFDGEITTTPFYINEEGHLFLSDFTTYYFIKIE